MVSPLGEAVRLRNRLNVSVTSLNVIPFLRLPVRVAVIFRASSHVIDIFRFLLFAACRETHRIATPARAALSDESSKDFSLAF